MKKKLLVSPNCCLQLPKFWQHSLDDNLQQIFFAFKKPKADLWKHQTRSEFCETWKVQNLKLWKDVIVRNTKIYPLKSVFLKLSIHLVNTFLLLKWKKIFSTFATKYLTCMLMKNWGFRIARTGKYISVVFAIRKFEENLHLDKEIWLYWTWSAGWWWAVERKNIEDSKINAQYLLSACLVLKCFKNNWDNSKNS